MQMTATHVRAFHQVGQTFWVEIQFATQKVCFIPRCTFNVLRKNTLFFIFLVDFFSVEKIGFLVNFLSFFNRFFRSYFSLEVSKTSVASFHRVPPMRCTKIYFHFLSFGGFSRFPSQRAKKVEFPEKSLDISFPTLWTASIGIANPN